MKIRTGPIDIAPNRPPSLPLEERLAWVRRHWLRHPHKLSSELYRLHKEVFKEPIEMARLVELRKEIHLAGNTDVGNEPEPFHPVISKEDAERLQPSDPVPEPEPDEEEEKEPYEEPAAVADEEIDVPVTRKPGTVPLSRSGKAVRYAHVIGLLRADPDMSTRAIIAAVTAEFGVSISTPDIARARRTVGSKNIKRRALGHGAKRPIEQPFWPPPPPSRKQRASNIDRTNKALRQAAADDVIREQMQELIDRVPQLLKLEVWYENDTPRYRFKLEETVITDGEGSL